MRVNSRNGFPCARSVSDAALLGSSRRSLWCRDNVLESRNKIANPSQCLFGFRISSSKANQHWRKHQQKVRWRFSMTEVFSVPDYRRMRAAEVKIVCCCWVARGKNLFTSLGEASWKHCRQQTAVLTMRQVAFLAVLRKDLEIRFRLISHRIREKLLSRWWWRWWFISYTFPCFVECKILCECS